MPANHEDESWVASSSLRINDLVDLELGVSENSDEIEAPSIAGYDKLIRERRTEVDPIVRYIEGADGPVDSGDVLSRFSSWSFIRAWALSLAGVRFRVSITSALKIVKN